MKNAACICKNYLGLKIKNLFYHILNFVKAAAQPLLSVITVVGLHLLQNSEYDKTSFLFLP